MVLELASPMLCIEQTLENRFTSLNYLVPQCVWKLFLTPGQLSMALQDLVQIVTNDFKTGLREENLWLLFAPFPVDLEQRVSFRMVKFPASKLLVVSTQS